MAKPDKKRQSRIRQKQRAYKVAQDYLDHSWAEDGMIFTRDKEGNTKMHTVREAAEKAMAINVHMKHLDMRMKDPKYYSPALKTQLDRGLAFVKKITELCKVAQRQKEDAGKTSKTQLLQNFVEGKDIQGRELVMTDEDERVQFLKVQFYTLDYDEIRAMLRSKEYPEEQKEALLSRRHTINVSKASGFNSDVIM